MTKPDRIFVKTERDCPFNTNIRDTLKRGGTTDSRIIYDYQIVEKGVPVGVWKKNSRSGYVLHDIANKIVADPAKKNYFSQAITVRSQNNFAIETMKYRELLPTEAQIVKRAEANMSSGQKAMLLAKNSIIVAAIQCNNKDYIPTFDLDHSKLLATISFSFGYGVFSAKFTHEIT
jgi:hypothetical protein